MTLSGSLPDISLIGLVLQFLGTPPLGGVACVYLRRREDVFLRHTYAYANTKQREIRKVVLEALQFAHILSGGIGAFGARQCVELFDERGAYDHAIRVLSDA